MRRRLQRADRNRQHARLHHRADSVLLMQQYRLLEISVRFSFFVFRYTKKESPSFAAHVFLKTFCAAASISFISSSGLPGLWWNSHSCLPPQLAANVAH